MAELPRPDPAHSSAPVAGLVFRELSLPHFLYQLLGENLLRFGQVLLALLAELAGGQIPQRTMLRRFRQNNKIVGNHRPKTD